MKQLSEVMAAILRKVDEDYAGLWEIPIVLRTAGIQEPERAAVSCVRKMIDEGLIACVWGNPDPDPTDALSTVESQQAMSDESFWHEDVPFQGRKVWVYATPKGEEWLKGRE